MKNAMHMEKQQGNALNRKKNTMDMRKYQGKMCEYSRDISRKNQ